MVWLGSLGLSTGMNALAMGPCAQDWELVAEYDNSFFWEDLGFLAVDEVTWTGRVQLWERYDSACYVVGAKVKYTGPITGGTLVLAGDPLVSFTVQYPEPFGLYRDVAQNANGGLVSWNPPAGEYLTHNVETNFGINTWGADEFVIKAKGLAATVTEVKAAFDLPLDFVGLTVIAQIHVGPDQCECSTTYIEIPGETPPPPVPECADGVDNDGDGLIDWPEDPGCADDYDNDETDTASPECADGVDNDGDELIDWPEDPGCVDDYDNDETNAPPPGATWSVYVHAHPDDWQLFQSPSAANDHQAGYSLLFIHVTAGDAGQPMSFWHAREEGAMASVQHVVGEPPRPSGPVTICYADPTMVCHDMLEWTLGSTVSIFMRLPDGGRDGLGFPSTNFQSIARLRDGLIPSITAIDGSTTYTSWADMYRTIAAIISTYAPQDSTTWVNAPDFDRQRQSFEGMTCNGCEDHSDHLATADAVHSITIAAGAPWSRRWFIDYPIAFADSRYPPNLTPEEYQFKKDTFMAYNARVLELSGYDTYATDPDFFERCFEREYFRSV